MTARTDWVRVVYGHGLEPEPRKVGDGPAVQVRQTPPELDLATAPRREQRVRLTILPADGAASWTLWLVDGEGAGGDGPGRHVWWRLEAGSWQPLEGGRARVAGGRGRSRLDVSLRLDRRPVVAPRLEFVAETSGSLHGERG